MSFGDSKLLWLDVETTGLDANTCTLLQVAAFITDSAGALLSNREFQMVVRNEDAEQLREDSDEYVQKMHDATGLWSKLQDGVEMEVVDRELSAFMKEFAPEPRSIKVAGNSVRLDLNFMEKYLPESYAHVHYHSVDVTAVHSALTAWGVAEESYPKQKSHDAMDDIRESLGEYLWLREKLLAFADVGVGAMKE